MSLIVEPAAFAPALPAAADADRDGRIAALTADLQEAHEQQVALSEVLRVINASPGDLAPVFDAVLDSAMRLCGAAFGTLRRYDGERLDTVAFRGVSAAYAEFLRANRYFRPTGTGLAELVHGDPVVHQIDVAAEAGYESPARRALVELGGARTMIAVALRREGALLGTITLYRQEVRPFTAQQIALLQSFAAQAVLAMDSARLFSELQARSDALSVREAQLRAIFDNIGDGIALFDRNGRLLAWNRNFGRIVGLPEEFFATPGDYADFLRQAAQPGEFGDDPEAEIARLAGEVGKRWSVERTRPSGQVLVIRNDPVPGGGFISLYSDITDLKHSEEMRAARDAAEAALRELQAAQQSLLHAEKMASLGKLTAGIAHEIKNPLNFVNNFASLSGELLPELLEAARPALAALDDDRRAEVDDVVGMLRRNLDKIAEHGRRADNIVQSMLMHSRGGGGDWRLADVNALVEESLNLAYHGARAQDQNFNIAIERDLAAELAAVEVVPQDLTRVFLNLFGNGFYATAARARKGEAHYRPALKVTTREAGDAVEIRVRDNGTGIPAEDRDKLFQPFFTTKPTGEGTGLGLSISYDIVTQQHGGTIAVDSREGAFTEFAIRLPRRRRAAAEAAT